MICCAFLFSVSFYDKNIYFLISNMNSDMVFCFKSITCFTFHVLQIAFSYGEFKFILKQTLYVIKMKKYMPKEYNTKLRCLRKLNFKPINFQVLKTLSKYSLVNQVVLLGNKICFGKWNSTKFSLFKIKVKKILFFFLISKAWHIITLQRKI